MTAYCTGRYVSCDRTALNRNLFLKYQQKRGEGYQRDIQLWLKLLYREVTVYLNAYMNSALLVFTNYSFIDSTIQIQVPKFLCGLMFPYMKTYVIKSSAEFQVNIHLFWDICFQTKQMLHDLYLNYYVCHNNIPMHSS